MSNEIVKSSLTEIMSIGKARYYTIMAENANVPLGDIG